MVYMGSFHTFTSVNVVNFVFHGYFTQLHGHSTRTIVRGQGLGSI